MRTKIKCGLCRKTIIVVKENKYTVVHKIKRGNLLNVIENQEGTAAIMLCQCWCGAAHFIEI